MARIIGTGSYLPRTVVGNDVFEAPRFRLRSGSERRHVADADEGSIFMAVEAAHAALEAAGVSGSDIDYVIGYCGMPDYLYPKDTNQIIERIGATKASGWTLDTACASAVSGLVAADALLAAGRAQRILIVVSMNWIGRGIDRENTDYSTLGDGAAALVVERSDSGLLGVVERTDPSGFDFVQLRSPFATGTSEHFEFSTDPRYREYFGSTVLKPAREVLDATETDPERVWFIPHQVGPTLLNIWSQQLGIAPERLLHTFAETANMSAANIPHIIDHHVRAGTIERGDRMLLFAPGAGMHLAAAVWEY